MKPNDHDAADGLNGSGGAEGLNGGEPHSRPPRPYPTTPSDSNGGHAAPAPPAVQTDNVNAREQADHDQDDGPEPPAEPWEEIFIAALREKGNVRHACITARISRTTAYIWRKKRRTFRAVWNEITEVQLDELEYSAYVRATAGVKVPIVYRGHQVKGPDGKPLWKIEYSDRLAEFMLSMLRGKKFARRDRAAGQDGAAPPAAAGTGDDVDATPTERAERLRAAMREIWDSTAVPPPPATDQAGPGAGGPPGPPGASSNGNGLHPNGHA